MDDVQECTIMCLSLQFVYIPFPLRESYMLDLLPQYFEIILLTWYVWHAEVVILLIWVTPVGWGNAANGFPTRWGGGGCSPCRSGELDTVWLITGGGGGCSSFQTSVLQEAPTLSYSSLNQSTPFLLACFTFFSLYILRANTTAWLCWLMGHTS